MDQDIETQREMARRGTAYQMMSAARSGTTHTSWVDINNMLRSMLWDIVGTVRPALHILEISLIYSDLKGGHWFGENGEESLYALAIRAGHPTAAASVERLMRREPFWIEEEGEKHRLYIGRVFTHNSERLRVTSFFEHGIRGVREGDGVKAGVVEVLREGLEAERAAVRKARLDKAKEQRELLRADPVPLLPLKEHLQRELSHYTPPDYLEFSEKYGSDYKAAYNAIPCGNAVNWYLSRLGVKRDGYTRSTADELRKNYPWSKVEQHLYQRLRRLRGLPLKGTP